MCSNTSDKLIIANLTLGLFSAIVWLIFISIVFYKNRDTVDEKPNNEINQATIPSVPIDLNTNILP